MKLTLNIETNDPADIARIASALAGDTPSPAAAAPARSAGKAKTETAPASAAPSGAAQSATTASASTPAPSEPATTSPSEPTVPAEAELISAANVAVGKVGAGGADKVKSYIAANFKKADGSPGTLKMVADDQKAGLLDALQKIGRGEITL